MCVLSVCIISVCVCIISVCYQCVCIISVCVLPVCVCVISGRTVMNESLYFALTLSEQPPQLFLCESITVQYQCLLFITASACSTVQSAASLPPLHRSLAQLVILSGVADPLERCSHNIDTAQHVWTGSILPIVSYFRALMRRLGGWG